MQWDRLSGALFACLVLLNLFSTTAFATAVPAQGTWETTLQPRDLDGNPATIEAYYDTTLDITWLADANAAVGSAYDTYSPGTGYMNWTDANAWAASLNINSITGWRLPTVTDNGNPVCITYSGGNCGFNVDTSTGEMASMFYDTLGNTAYYDTSGTATGCGSNPPDYCLSNTGPFSNLKSYTYWSATEFSLVTFNAWYFNFNSGLQYDLKKTNVAYAWAVHDGVVGAAIVPVPAAVWLFGSGLLGLIGTARRSKRHG